MKMTYVSMPTLSVRSYVLVMEAMVENKEHLLQVRENEDDLCFHAHTFSGSVWAEQDKLLFHLF